MNLLGIHIVFWVMFGLTAIVDLVLFIVTIALSGEIDLKDQENQLLRKELERMQGIFDKEIVDVHTKLEVLQEKTTEITELRNELSRKQAACYRDHVPVSTFNELLAERDGLMVKLTEMTGLRSGQIEL